MAEWRNRLDAQDLKSCGYCNHVGSIPTSATKILKIIKLDINFLIYKI